MQLNIEIQAKPREWTNVLRWMFNESFLSLNPFIVWNKLYQSDRGDS